MADSVLSNGPHQATASRHGCVQPKPDLSLVVSTIGRPETFPRLLSSLVRQLSGRLKVELIVVDQSGRNEMLDALHAANLPFPYRHIRAEIGLSRARNIGLQAATGRYVMFPDDDVWFVEPMLEPAVELLDNRPELAGLCGRLTAPDGSNSMLRWSKRAGPVSHRNHHRRSIGAVVLMRREMALSVDGFDQKMGPGTGYWYGSCEDADFILRVLEAGGRVWYEPGLHVYHRDTSFDSGADTIAKSLAYGCGQGRMWRTRNFGPLWILFLILRRIASSVLVSRRGHRDVGRARMAWVRGALNGLMDRPPTDLTAGGVSPEVQIEAEGSAGRQASRELVGSLIWRIAVTVAGMAATVVLMGMLARSLATAELAVFYSLLAALAVVPILGRMGLGTEGLREISRLRSLGQSPAAAVVARNTIRLCVGPSVVVGACVAAIVVVTPSDGRALVPVLLGAVVLAGDSLRQALSDVLLGLGRVIGGSLLSHSVRSTGLAAVVGVDRLVAGAPLDLTRLFTLMASTVLFLLGLGIVYLAWVTKAAAGNADAPRGVVAATAALSILAIELVSVLISRGDVWLANVAFNADRAATYGTASVLAKQIGMPIGLINIAFAPVAAGLLARRDIANLERLVRTTVTAVGLLLVPVLIVALVAGDVILTVLYGTEFADGHRYLGVLLLGNVSIIAFGVGTTVLIMARRQRLAMWISLAWLAMIGPTAALAALVGGPTALALASSLGTVGLVSLQAFAAWVVTGARLYPDPSLILNPAYRSPRAVLRQARELVV